MIRRTTLEELLEKAASGAASVVTHSGRVTPGGIFVLMPASVPRGGEEDAPGGEQWLEAALKNKPAYVLCHPRHIPLLESLHAECAVAPSLAVRRDLGQLARAMHHTNTACPKVVGITGTNGKTTESYLLEAMLRNLGMAVGVIGTVSYRWPGHEEDAPLTTPGCLELHSMLARMAAANAQYAFMEVSSHALDQERVAGIDFSAALLTNVTQDHLDYHKDMDDYFQAKARLFLPEDRGGVPFDGKKRVANVDDAMGRRLLEMTPGGLGFGLTGVRAASSRHLAGEILSLSPQGLRLRMSYEGRNWELASPLVGVFNAMNLLGAQALGLELGLEPEQFAALASFAGVSGRLERVPNKHGLNVFVDYAHTPDALAKAISALRDAGFARIITVFGCGGNRDRKKRPLMGQAVAALTDVAVLTSDNPRDEDPEAIMADVLPGLALCPEVVSLADRRAALAKSLELLGKNDALLVAGKGHERYQLVKGVKHPFSDQDILRELMQ